MASDFAARSRQFQDALSEALAGSDTAALDAGVMNQLAQLVDRARTVAGDHEHVIEALDALDAIARREDVDGALSEAAALFESPHRFREALYFARCLDHDPALAQELMHARGYLSAAVVPVATYPDLASEQAELLAATSFETLWREPGRLRAMVESAGAWRQEYIPLYQAAHAASSRAIEVIALDVDAKQPQAEAIEKLNGLRRLGGPLAEPALVRFHEMAGLSVCPANPDHLAEALLEEPTCAHCGIRLGDTAPASETASVIEELDRALSTHQVRLRQRVVPRLVAQDGRRPDARIDRFIQAADGGEPSVLVQVLDEGMLGFIEDLLETPEPRVNLIERLGREYPEVTPENLDAVVESFRRIAADELARSGGRVRIGADEEPA